MELDHFSGYLSVRTYNALQRAGISTLEALREYNDEDLLEIRNFGAKGLEEVHQLKAVLFKRDLPPSIVGANLSDEDDADSSLAPSHLLAHEMGLSLTSLSKAFALSWVDLLVQGNTWSQIELFDEALKAKGLPRLNPLPTTPLIPLSSIQFLIKIGCPIAQIPSTRLSLSNSETRLLKNARISTVLGLFLVSQTDDNVIGDSWNSLRHYTQYYAEWLASQVDWTAEIDNNLPNPVALKYLNGLTLGEILNELLYGVDKRNLEIVLTRYGILAESETTLQELGDQLGLSRERVRQLIVSTVKKVRRNLQTSAPLRTLVKLFELTIDSRLVINKEALVIALHQYMSRIDDVDLDHLVVFLMTGVFKDTLIIAHRLSDDVWVSTKLGSQIVSRTITSIAQCLKKNMTPMRLEEISSALAQSSDLPPEWVRNAQFLHACLEADKKFQLADDQYWVLASWNKHLFDDIVMALREIARPAHFTEIAEFITAKRRPTDQPVSGRNVHAQLGRYTNLFIRTGPGTFTLRELNPEAPTNPPKYIDLIERVLEEIGRPLTAEEVFQRVNDIRPARFSSVVMYLGINPRFAKYDNNMFGLTSWATTFSEVDTPSDDWLEKVKMAAFKELSSRSEE